MNFWPFRLLYWLLKKITFSKTIIKKEGTYKVFVDDGIGWMNLIDRYEEWFEELLSDLQLDENAVFIDVGANIGQTMLKVLPVYQNVVYIGIEPNEKCISYLHKLAEINNFKNVKFHNYALADKSGETPLLLRFADDILATTSPSFRKFTNYANKVIVKEITGDLLISNEAIENVDVIKIDVEGGEALALSGLKNTISTHQPAVICEILPVYSKSDEVVDFRVSAANQIMNITNELHYDVYNIITREKVISVGGLSNSLESANYIFLPNDGFLNLRKKMQLH